MGAGGIVSCLLKVFSTLAPAVWLWVDYGQQAGDNHSEDKFLVLGLGAIAFLHPDMAISRAVVDPF
jgi:hypothetical protein